MYTIYYLNKCLILQCGKDSRSNIIQNQSVTSAEIDQESELAINYLENSNIIDPLKIYSQDLEELWKTFKSKFRYIEAAGGIVRNPKDRILMIYRLGRWDLPKGKLDKGESPERAAVREVSEECGIEEPELKELVGCSYHIFKTSKRTVLKKTWWYNMEYHGVKKGTPQEEENITKVKWFKRHKLKKALKNTYPIISSLIHPLYKAKETANN